MRRTTTSADAREANMAKNATDMLRMRKELIQARSRIADLQDELEEKTQLYLNAIKTEKLQNAKENIQNVEVIVQQKVQEAIASERAEMVRLKQENERLTQTMAQMENTIRDLNATKTEYLERNMQQSEMLQVFTTNQDMKEAFNRIQELRQKLEGKDKENTKHINLLNKISGQCTDLAAENSVLRQMANVPDNYGIDIKAIQTYNSHRIEDFKKLISVLQDDNYKLESERAVLKHQLKMQAMMYKSNSSDPRVRYNELTDEQLMSVDQFVLRIISGDAIEPADFYRIRKENEELRQRLEAVQGSGLNGLSDQLKNLLQNGGAAPQQSNPNASGNNLEYGQSLQALQQNNAEVIDKLNALLASVQGIGAAGVGGSGGTIPIVGGASAGYSGRFAPPQPHPDFDGGIERGALPKFGGAQMGVHSPDGQVGLNKSNVYEHAFLQLQLKETFELNSRLQSQMKSQQDEIDSLYRRIRNYLLTQDQLYKDYIRVERHYQKKEGELKEKVIHYEKLIQEEKDRNAKKEALIQTLTSNQPEAVSTKLIELTKQNSILDLNLLRLTRKYTILQEQERLIRREYHSMDTEMAQKDRFVQQKINDLKEWKANAMNQLQFLFQKLRIAVPLSQLKTVHRDLETQLQRNADMDARCIKLTKRVRVLEKQIRDNEEAEEKLKVANEEIEGIEEEFEIVKKRLENLDPVFKWENSIYQKIANILKRANVSPVQAFEEFDQNGDGQVSKAELRRALEEKLRVYDLLPKEFDILWASLDTDRSNTVQYGEFVRKLERYGVKNLSREEFILLQIVKACRRSDISMGTFFEMCDKHGNNFISREDFKDIFREIPQLDIQERELEQFMDNFWRDKSAGMDYKAFLRIFAKYEIQLNNEQNAKRAARNETFISDEVIRKKKTIFDRIKDALNMSGGRTTLKDLFKRADENSSYKIDKEEFGQMLRGLRMDDISKVDVQQLFESVDFDGSGQISLIEFKADFEQVTSCDVETLLRDNKSKMSELQNMNPNNMDERSLVDLLNKPETREIQLQTTINQLQARVKRFEKRLSAQQNLVMYAESQSQEMQKQATHLEKENDALQTDNFNYKQTIKILEEKMGSMIQQEKAEKLEQDNERMQTGLAETRSAMLSYKNMCGVIAEQAHALKLMHERKKDEHDSLLEALRENQAESATQERIGKLYFIIMLSRWQEAAINKKYEQTVSETRKLRSEVLSGQAIIIAREGQVESNEALIQKTTKECEDLRHEIEKTKAIYMTQTKAQQLQLLCRDLSDDKTELEDAHLKMRGQVRSAQDELDAARAKAEQAQTLLQTLKNSRQSDLSDQLVKLSDDFQKVRLESYRKERAAQEAEEKVTYLQRRLKNRNEEVYKLEKKTVESENQMIKQKEEHRKLENERLHKFFYRTFADHNERPQTSNMQQMQQNQKNTANQLSEAAGFTTTNTRRIHTQDADAAIQRIHSANNQQNQESDWASKALVEQRGEQIRKLEEQVKMMRAELTTKDSEVNRYKVWQEGDRYLSRDEMLKEAIQEHRVKTMEVQEEEQKEMADAAYQTINTLQEMLDTKNEVIRKKEEQVVKLRDQMSNQAQADANVINELRQKMSLTGNTTLSKLHDIVSRQGVETAQTRTSSAAGGRPNTQNSSQAFEGVQRQMDQKDSNLRKLQRERDSAAKEKESIQRKNEELRRQIQTLQDELRVASDQRDLKKAEQRISALKKDLSQQKQINANLRKSIDEFHTKMVQYESEKTGAVDTADKLTKKQKYDVQVKDEEIQRLKDKYTNIQARKVKFEEQVKELNVTVSEKDEQITALSGQKTEIQTRIVSLQEQIEKLSKENRRLQNEISRLEETHKIGGSGLSVDKLTKQIAELELQNKDLESKAHPVVAKNVEFGTFEYIGKAMPLAYGGSASQVASPSKDPRDVQEVLQQMKEWLVKNDRLTVRPIFHSVDQGGFGEIKEANFVKAFARLGIQLKASEISLLKKVLDPRQVGFLKYTPLVNNLQGIPQKEFVTPAVEKLALYAISKDLPRDKFRDQLDPQMKMKLTKDDFGRALNNLRAKDFDLSESEVADLFKQLTGSISVSLTSTVATNKVLNEVFTGVQAVIIFRMQRGLKHSRKHLVDLLEARDADKDGYLTYNEVENLLTLDIDTGFPVNIFEQVVVRQMFDPENRLQKVSKDTLRRYLTCDSISSKQDSAMDLIPTQDIPSRESAAAASSISANQAAKKAGQKVAGVQVTPQLRKQLQEASRKLLTGYDGTFGEVLTKEDSKSEGLLSIERITEIVSAKQITALQPSEIQLILGFCDANRFGFLVIPNLISKLNELASETDGELKMRRFAKMVGNQGINLRTELCQYDSQGTGLMTLLQFKRSMKQLSVALMDNEIKELFDYGMLQQDLNPPKTLKERNALANCTGEQLLILQFIALVQQAYKAKPLPSFLSQTASTGLKFGLRPGQTGQSGAASGGAGSSTGKANQFENYEVEKKYKKTIEALREEIQERNQEIQIAHRESDISNKRVEKLEKEKQGLEAALVNNRAKPPRQMADESKIAGAIGEIQDLKDKVFQLEEINDRLKKEITVNLKAELLKITDERDSLDEKLNVTTDKLRRKRHELQQAIGQPLDAIGRREEGEFVKQKRIDELEDDLAKAESKIGELNEELFKVREKNLDLDFEKKSFDMKFARVQKRIKDMEQYQYASSSMSASIKNKSDADLASIAEATAKLNADDLSKQPGETNKIRNRPTQSVAQLEQVISSLRRVIDKKQVEVDHLKKENAKLTGKVGMSGDVPKLYKQIGELETALHSAEQREVNTLDQDRTIKKLIMANQQLREDMKREIERYNLLEGKFKDLLFKYSSVAEENKKNKERIFAVQSGARMQNYQNFLDESGDFGESKKGRSTYARQAATQEDGLDTFEKGLEDSLNKIKF